jgi:hypothetical protein
MELIFTLRQKRKFRMSPKSPLTDSERHEQEYFEKRDEELMKRRLNGKDSEAEDEFDLEALERRKKYLTRSSQ